MKRWTIACFGIAIILMFLSMFFMGVACVVDPAANICSGASGAPQTQTNSQTVNILDGPVLIMADVEFGMVM